MSDLIQLSLRRDTAANWTTTDPVLASGEKALETDTKFQKIGDGVTAWSALPYWHGPPWINNLGGGGPASTFPGAPFNPHGLMGKGYPGAPVPVAPPPPIVIQESASWYFMQALGRGPATNELMVIGEEFSGTLDLGILNTDTNLFTSVAENIFNGTTLTTCDGIDMDRSTGVIVAIQGNNTSNNYPAFWSDDLGVTWTACTSPSTSFAGQGMIMFDENHGLWYWSTGTRTFVSNDGKAFVYQQVNFEGFGTFNMTATETMMHSGFFGSAAFGGANGERLWGFDPTTTNVPIPTAGNTEVWEGYSISGGGLFSPANPRWNAGIMVFEDEIYFASGSGEIIKSPNGGRGIGNWSIVAEDNEITDGFDRWAFMKNINGVFWFCRENGGLNKWYRWGTGGAPVGYGWVLDNTGPFGTTTIAQSGSRPQTQSDPSQRFAYIGAEVRTFPISPSHVYYDINS
jgi:hypothetical protein